MLYAREHEPGDAVNTFEMALRSPIAEETVTGVSDFIGEDATGSFGLRARHEAFMTVLVFGLARFRLGEGGWEYLALPGALLHFSDNRLWLTTRRYQRDTDYERITATLSSTLVAEEERMQAGRESLRRLEEAMLRRLWEMGRGR